MSKAKKIEMQTEREGSRDVFPEELARKRNHNRAEYSERNGALSVDKRKKNNVNERDETQRVCDVQDRQVK